MQAIAAILETLQSPLGSEQGQSRTKGPDGKALIYVWALEQKNSRRGWVETDEQDVMVPWVTKSKIDDCNRETSTTFNRYYHLYRQGELEKDILDAGGTIVESGYEKDNWWVIAARCE